LKFKIFGFTISNEDEKTTEKANQTKIDTSKEKLISALKEIEDKQLKYSEYRLQKLSGLSLNTIKKYREFIEVEQSKIRNRLI